MNIFDETCGIMGGQRKHELEVNIVEDNGKLKEEARCFFLFLYVKIFVV